jgi:hypothetical protein
MEMTTSNIASEQLVRRVRGEYLEMPGLRLTRLQAQRLWAMDQQTCADVLAALIEVGFLRRQQDGTYTRLVDGPMTFPAPRMLKAEERRESRPLARVG